MRNPWVRAAVGFVWGLSLFLAIGWLLKLGLGPEWKGSPILVAGRLEDVDGPRRPDRLEALGEALPRDGLAQGREVEPIVSGPIHDRGGLDDGRVGRHALLGVRHPLASQMSFLQIVLLIWLLSSFSEEVYVRGLVAVLGRRS